MQQIRFFRKKGLEGVSNCNAIYSGFNFFSVAFRYRGVYLVDGIRKTKLAVNEHAGGTDFVSQDKTEVENVQSKV